MSTTSSNVRRTTVVPEDLLAQLLPPLTQVFNEGIRQFDLKLEDKVRRLEDRMDNAYMLKSVAEEQRKSQDQRNQQFAEDIKILQDEQQNRAIRSISLSQQIILMSITVCLSSMLSVIAALIVHTLLPH